MCHFCGHFEFGEEAEVAWCQNWWTRWSGHGVMFLWICLSLQWHLAATVMVFLVTSYKNRNKDLQNCFRKGQQWWGKCVWIRKHFEENSCQCVFYNFKVKSFTFWLPLAFLRKQVTYSCCPQMLPLAPWSSLSSVSLPCLLASLPCFRLLPPCSTHSPFISQDSRNTRLSLKLWLIVLVGIWWEAGGDNRGRLQMSVEHFP